MSQANPALAQTPMPGQKGGSYGFAVQPMNVGENSPNVAPIYQPVPCDGRAGSPNAMNPTSFLHDPRAPADLFSMTPNQSGGSYGSGNNYASECYKGTGSSLPVYEAETAGFEFRPSIENGGTLPDGVTAYMDVLPKAARMGGARKTKKAKRTNRTRSQ
jgi:hypothetical protein